MSCDLCPPTQSENDSDTGGVDGEPTPKKTRKSRVRKKKSTIYDVYEPSELERGHFLERDAEIRVTDQPERFQVRSVPVQPPEGDAELELEAEWVYENAFSSYPISKQVGVAEREGVGLGLRVGVGTIGDLSVVFFFLPPSLPPAPAARQAQVRGPP